ncbi:MAG: GNAT family N-acetyltransferase [Rhodoferax sp.]|nr:GNAT family N-acetyltransferase [Rhodoferax sp.]MDP3652908.1 GNAT family N-acetyltransferase [Rhodoferax sp.]
MHKKSNQFLVLKNYQEIAPFVEQVVSSADQNKNSLGFFAASVFQEFARSEQMHVLVEKSFEETRYAGHLMFKCSRGKASVLQMFVAPLFRRCGAAKILLDGLKSHLTDHGLIFISARVAEDLIDANAFWESQSFYVQRVAQGGAVRKRQILVRCHELESPQLFASSGLSSTNPLGLDVTTKPDIPLYLLDMNVLFDLGPRRLRNAEAIDLFRAERMGLCRFAISSELSAELHRTATPGRTDPMQAYTKIFPTFSLMTTNEWGHLFPGLASLVFPLKESSQFSENDKSDLRHLSVAIQHRLAGFITNDSAILDAATKIKNQFDIQVISPTAFAQSHEESTAGDAYDTSSMQTLELMPITEVDGPSVQALLSRLNLSGSSMASSWAAVDSGNCIFVRYGVWSGVQLLGYLTRPNWTPSDMVVAHIAIDESAPHSRDAARILLTNFLEQMITMGTVQVRIEFPRNQVHVREVASELGFGGTSTQTSLSKVILGRIVIPANWDHCKGTLLSAGRLKLPDAAPTFRHVSQQIQILTPDGNRVHVSLENLETLLAPALFCLPGRHAVITPVQRDFSEHLLGHLPQKLLLPQSKVALYQEKHYVSGPQTLKRFRPGSLILFYESLKHKGLGAVIAVARVKQVYAKSQEALKTSGLDPSVLDAKSLETIGQSEMKTVTVFDNVICLPRPVPLTFLERIGCGRPTDLITTNSITDEQLQAILAEGLTCD